MFPSPLTGIESFNLMAATQLAIDEVKCRNENGNSAHPNSASHTCHDTIFDATLLYYYQRLLAVLIPIS